MQRRRKRVKQLVLKFLLVFNHEITFAGINVGPLTASTRKLYIKKLEKLVKQSHTQEGFNVKEDISETHRSNFVFL